MDVFSVYDYNQPTGKLGQKESTRTNKASKSSRAKSTSSEAPLVEKKAARRPNKDQQEILAKVESLRSQQGSAQAEISRAALAKNKQLPAPFDETPNEKAAKVQLEVSVSSPIQGNDPSDTVTRDKLKEALQSGVVNFSSRERSVLEKIL